MLTFFFILTLVFAELGGGGTIQAPIKTETEELCKALRRAIMTQLPDMNGHAGPCRAIVPAEIIEPEVD